MRGRERRGVRGRFRGSSPVEFVVFLAWTLGATIGCFGGVLGGVRPLAGLGGGAMVAAGVLCLTNYENVAHRLGKRRMPLDPGRGGRGSFHWRAFGLVATILGGTVASTAARSAAPPLWTNRCEVVALPRTSR